MSKTKYTKAGLMRRNKAELLALASDIEFITDENTKSEIADAILIMSLTIFEGDEGPGSAANAARAAGEATAVDGPVSPTGPQPVNTAPASPANSLAEGEEPPASARIRRIREASQRQS